jgi:hypothetical protein
VKVWYVKKGPTSKDPQPRLGPAEKEVLQRKISKQIDRGYITSTNRCRSVIKYFAVPKGIVDDVVQDWRIVFHAGANKLNDAVFVPSFSLPTVNSLLWLVDGKTLMSDRDMGDMFLNFQLHANTVESTAIDLRPLDLDKSKYPHRWMCWRRNLMGFKSSPYNSVRMYLIAEEILRGDRMDYKNPFQWESLMLNLPGDACYSPADAWISKRRADNSRASDFVCFVDDQRITGEGEERVEEAGHALSTRESYLGLQDALRKVRHPKGSKRPGAWAGVNVVIEDDGSVAVMTSQEKWNRLKAICTHWLGEINAGRLQLDFKKLQSDRGFLVYVTQAYPGMKPYLKGFHLSLETWRGGRDEEGWKVDARKSEENVEVALEDVGDEMDAIKLGLLTQSGENGTEIGQGPPAGRTTAVPRFKRDLEALLHLAGDANPAVRRIRSGRTKMVVYGFGDASAAGFGATVDRPGRGLFGRFGIWGKDAEDGSSNYRELRNLVETVEEEAAEGYLEGGELWIFTDNSTAESCVHKGGSTSAVLHELVVRLRKCELDQGFVIYVVHVAGTRMIAQGTDGLSRGSLLEGVVAGSSMLSFIDLALPAIRRSPKVVDFVRSWAEPVLGEVKVLAPHEWFVEGHGIIGGEKDAHGIWIPSHAVNGRAYLWSPAPVIADVALEECLKAVHKRTDAYHIFVIPRLFSPRWMRMLYKLADFVFPIPPGATHWPCSMHEPLFIGISFPLLNRPPWTLQRTPLLVGLERQLRQVQATGESNGGDILRQLLRTPRRLAGVSEDVARKVLRMPGNGEVSGEENGR